MSKSILTWRAELWLKLKLKLSLKLKL
jgi:hypothetical protein